MNNTTINTTLDSCGSVPYVHIAIPRRTHSPDLRAVFIFRIAVNAISRPRHFAEPEYFIYPRIIE